MSTDYKKLTAQKEELKATWDFLDLPFEYPQKQIPLWLLDYGKDMIESAFRTLKQKEDKITNPAAYLATMLRNAKKRDMTPEERAQEISQMRSLVGKIGAAKSHEKEVSYIKDEFAKVCSDLPQRG